MATINTPTACRRTFPPTQASFDKRRKGSSRLLGSLLLTALPAAWCAPARAGVVLLSRESYIHTAGGPSSGGFNVSQGTTQFGRFANDVSSDPSAGDMALGEAHQYSLPGVVGNSFQGAFAEGSVQSGGHGPGMSAMAESNFNLTFEVTGSPSPFTFGAAMGTAGSGITQVALVPLSMSTSSPLPLNTGGGKTSGSPLVVPPAPPIFSGQLAPGVGNSKVMDQSGTLAPGLYVLKVQADSDGAAEGSSAYYNVNLSVSSGASSSAVPLPPGAWTGLGVLLATCGLTIARRFRAI